MNGISAMTRKPRVMSAQKTTTGTTRQSAASSLDQQPLEHLPNTRSAIAPNQLSKSGTDNRRRAAANEQLADILQSVVKASRDLAEEPDFEMGINRWLAKLGEGTDAARASFYDSIGKQGDADHHLRALAEWTRAGVEHSNVVSFDQPVLIPIDHASREWMSILANKPLIATPENTKGSARTHLEEQGNKAVLLVPFMVDGRSWAVSFDFQVAREFDDRTLAILQTAANSVASEILRRDAEAAKLKEQQDRADENARLANILNSVVRASRELADEPNFEIGINRWLAKLGEGTDAARASIYDTVGNHGTSDLQFRALAEWVREGVTNSILTSFAEPIILPMDFDSEIWKSIERAQPFVVTLKNANERLRELLIEQGNKTVLMVSFFVGDRTWSVAFDFLVERDFDDRTLAILQTAANSIASEILRREADAAKLKAEHQRADEAEDSARVLARRRDLLEAVVATSDRLLAATTLDEAAEWTCEQLGRALAGDRVLIGRFLPPDDGSKLGYYDWTHEWAAPDIVRQTDDPSLKIVNMDRYADFHASLLRNQPLAVITAEIPSIEGQDEQASLGVQSLFAYPIFVGGELWGVLDVDDCRTPRIWDEGEIATLSLVASAIASTVERERLTQSRINAERALSDERSRMAREIHDTLAQGFTGVIMQTQAAEEALNKRDNTAVLEHLGRARTIAASSLRDARRSVFAMLPSILQGRTLAGALAHQLATMAAGVKVVASFGETGEPRSPSNLVATEFIRIAQEATTNALRHAQARKVRIALGWDGDVATLTITDDGVGFNTDLKQTGFGLVSIRERSQRMGAELKIDSTIGQGTMVRVAAIADRRLVVDGA